MAGRTPSQTVGPFFHEALRWSDGGRIEFADPGKRVALKARIVDGAGAPVADAMVETWQVSAAGASPKPASGAAKPNGFGRVETTADGGFRIDTQMPAGRAPHLEVAIFARGLLKPLRTRVYFAPEDKVRAEADLASLADSPRLATLVAKPTGSAEYRWVVRLQGDGETVFFAA